jgi:hypothetical protein
MESQFHKRHFTLLSCTNGLASRSIPEGGSGSGGTGETLLILAPFLAKRCGRERRREAHPERSVGGSRCLSVLSLSKGPLETLLGGNPYKSLHSLS